MPGLAAFLKPTWVKAIFLLEWAAFVSINVARGQLRTTHQLLVAAYPFAFFYLVACGLTAWSRRRQQLGGSLRLLALGAGVVVLEQVIKSLVAAFLPPHATVPLIDDWLRLANWPNPHGSWVAGALGVMPAGGLLIAQWIEIGGMLLVSGGARRFYVATQRQSLWVDVAFLGVFVGCAGWMCDMGFRGHIADFINLPGVTTCDLKDIFISIGAPACLAEAIENRKLGWRWRGWRTEAEDSARFVRDLRAFAAREWREVRRVVSSWLGTEVGDRRR